MPKLTIMRGVPGSGKSTWVAQQTGNIVVVSRDNLRASLFGTCDQSYYKVEKDVLKARENFITKVQDNAILDALKGGHDVIVDNTGIQWKHVEEIAALGWKAGAEVVVKLIDVPLAKALMQNVARRDAGGRYVPENVIAGMHSELQGTKNRTLTRPESRQYTGTPGKPKAFMVDIDGTLAHMNGKRKPFEWMKVDVDDVDETVAHLVNTLYYADDYVVIVMSGRDEVCRDLTLKWLLDKAGLSYDVMFMRGQGDMRPDNIVKAELFDKHVRDNYDVQFVIDDRWKVCEMWLQMGLKVFNVSGLDRGEF